VSVGDLVHVYLRPELEYYVTPTGPDQLNIAVLCGKAFTKTLAGRLHEGLHEMAVRDPELAQWLDGAEPVSVGALCGPLRQRVRAASSDRVVLVGDAAGFVDAITGEGMSLGLMAAELAADELSGALRQGDLSGRRLSRYDRRKRRQSASVLWLTHIVLWGLRDRRVARWIVRNLSRYPASFDRVLAVQSHQRKLWQLGPLHAAHLVLGL